MKKEQQNLKTIFNDNSSRNGFSFIEILVAVGALSIVSLAFMNIIENFNKAQRGVRAVDALRDFAVEIRSTLSDKAACINTFNDNNLSTGKTLATTVKDSSNTDKYIAGNSYMGALLVFKNLTVKDFISDGSPNVGKAKLFIYADKTGAVIGPQTSYYVLTLQVEMDASKKIIKCLSVGGLNDSLWQVSSTSTNDIFYQGGRVGIGTSTPNAPLSIVSETNAYAPGVATFYYNDSNGYANGYSGGRARGSLSTPTALKTGDRFLSFIGAAYSGSYFHNSVSMEYVATEDHSSAGQGAAITFLTSANQVATSVSTPPVRAERMRIDHNGNVGIGTTSPVSNLDINANLQNPVLSLRTNGTNSTTQSVINLHSKDDGHLLGSSPNNLGWALYARGSTYSYGGDTPNKFGISYWDGTNWNTPYFNIMPNGNVGIGTTSPVTKLDVNGPVRPGNMTNGSACSMEGAFAYDNLAHKPVFCNGTNWVIMGGGGGTIVTTILTQNACGNSTINLNCASPYTVTGCSYKLTYWDSSNPNNSPDEVYPVANGCQMHPGGGSSCYDLYTICAKIN